MPVREMLARIGSDEITEWIVLEKRDPLPDGFYQMAVIASTLVNMLGGKKAAKVKPIDFMPWAKRHDERRYDSARNLDIMRGKIKAQKIAAEGRV